MSEAAIGGGERRSATEVGRERREALQSELGEKCERARGWLRSTFSGISRKVDSGVKFLARVGSESGGRVIDGVLGIDQAAKNAAAEARVVGREVKEGVIEGATVAGEAVVTGAKMAGAAIIAPPVLVGLGVKKGAEYAWDASAGVRSAVATEAREIGQEVMADLREFAETPRIISEGMREGSQYAGEQLVAGYNRTVEIKNNVLAWGKEKWERTRDAGRSAREAILNGFSDAKTRGSVEQLLKNMETTEAENSRDRDTVEMLNAAIGAREAAIASMKNMLAAYTEGGRVEINS